MSVASRPTPMRTMPAQGARPVASMRCQRRRARPPRQHENPADRAARHRPRRPAPECRRPASWRPSDGQSRGTRLAGDEAIRRGGAGIAGPRDIVDMAADPLGDRRHLVAAPQIAEVTRTSASKRSDSQYRLGRDRARPGPAGRACRPAGRPAIEVAADPRRPSRCTVPRSGRCRASRCGADGLVRGDRHERLQRPHVELVGDER